jgi:ribosomal protein L28
MRRKHLLVGVMVAGLFLTGTGTAQAWDLIHSKSGYDRVTLRAWTRNYNQVAFVADHAGTRIDVSIRVVCANGDTYENTWSDGGNRFRFVLGGLGNSRRCDHTFKVDGRKPSAELTLAIFGRG